jgi:hypothetical protein
MRSHKRSTTAFAALGAAAMRFRATGARSGAEGTARDIGRGADREEPAGRQQGADALHRRRQAGAAGVGAALAVSAALLVACGGDDDAARVAHKAPKLASAAVIDGDPYAIACAHVRDQQNWADATRRATVALADRERIAGLNRLQATQSLYYAMTEVCKGQAASYKPGKDAIRGVRQGTYRADLGAP